MDIALRITIPDFRDVTMIVFHCTLKHGRERNTGVGGLFFHVV